MESPRHNRSVDRLRGWPRTLATPRGRHLVRMTRAWTELPEGLGRSGPGRWHNPKQYACNGTHDQSYGPARARVCQVFAIEFDTHGHELLDVGGLDVVSTNKTLASPEVKLRRAGEARAVPEDLLLCCRVTARQGHGLRSGANQGHLAAENVDKLRQLIDAGGSQDASEAGHPTIAGSGQLRSGFAGPHTAELEHRERRTTLAHPNLAVNPRGPRRDPRPYPDGQHQGAQNHEGGARHNDVEQASERARPNRLPHVDDRLH